MPPYLLSANQPPARMYSGGTQIHAFRVGLYDPSMRSPSGQTTVSQNSAHPSEHLYADEKNQQRWDPEDWIASTTCCQGQLQSNEPLGLSVLSDGRRLTDAISADPAYWLGRDHVAAYGTDTKLLVKLLDAGQRLPIHAHPSREWVQQHLAHLHTGVAALFVARSHGKAELWFFLRGGTVWLGLKKPISYDCLLSLVLDSQYSIADELLPKMHEQHVEAGQAVFVPPGTLHAIGEGILIAEVQEPSDWSVLCEWNGYRIDGAENGHLGVGFDLALTAVNTDVLGENGLMQLVAPQDANGVLFEEDTREYFRVSQLNVNGKSHSDDASFAIYIVIDGILDLHSFEPTGEVSTIRIKKGNTLVVPHASGRIVLEGKGKLLIAKPPKVLLEGPSGIK